jgi:hypothetical protein
LFFWLADEAMKQTTTMQQNNHSLVRSFVEVLRRILFWLALKLLAMLWSCISLIPPLFFKIARLIAPYFLGHALLVVLLSASIAKKNSK